MITYVGLVTILSPLCCSFLGASNSLCVEPHLLFRISFSPPCASMLPIMKHRNQSYQGPFMPLVPQTQCAPFNDTEQLKDFITDETCAVIVEPIQGESGVWLSVWAEMSAFVCVPHMRVG